MNGTRKCFIFTGGKDFYPERMTELPCERDLVIAADSGCENLLLFSERVKCIAPCVILGDMDSYGGSLKNDFPDVRFIPFPPEKDDTDTSLAVKYALSDGCKDIVIVGGLGGRLDHTLANVFLLEYIRQNGARGMITNGKNIAYLAEKKNYFEKNSKKYVSLIPLDASIKNIVMRGFKYDIKRQELERSFFVTVSNEITASRALIEVGEGQALIVCSED